MKRIVRLIRYPDGFVQPIRFKDFGDQGSYRLEEIIDITEERIKGSGIEEVSIVVHNIASTETISFNEFKKRRESE